MQVFFPAVRDIPVQMPPLNVDEIFPPSPEERLQSVMPYLVPSRPELGSLSWQAYVTPS